MKMLGVLEILGDWTRRK